MTDSTGPLDGWEFWEEDCSITADAQPIESLQSDHVILWRDTLVEMSPIVPLPTLRAVLDELERRARAKWGETWGLPPGTCPRCRGNKVIPVYRPGSIDLADVDFGLGCLGGSPAGSGFDPCPECSG